MHKGILSYTAIISIKNEVQKLLLLSCVNWKLQIYFFKTISTGILIISLHVEDSLILLGKINIPISNMRILIFYYSINGI